MCSENFKKNVKNLIKNEPFGVILGMVLMPLLMFASNDLDKIVDVIITAAPSLIFLTHVKTAMYILILITPVALPIVMWRWNRAFSLALAITTLFIGMMILPQLGSIR